jgi:hypothetical protein
MQPKEKKTLVFLARQSVLKPQKRIKNSKLFRSFSPQRKPMPPLFPKPVVNQCVVKSNTNLLNPSVQGINKHFKVNSFDRLTIENLLSSSHYPDKNEENSQISKRKVIHKRKAQSFYKNFDTNEVLSIYGIKSKQKIVNEVSRPGNIFSPNENIEKFLEKLKEKSKVLMEKIQKSYK